MTATSMAPYLDFLGTTVVAELELTVVEAELVVGEALELVEVTDPDPVAVDRVVAAVELPLLVPVADEEAFELSAAEDPVEV